MNVKFNYFARGSGCEVFVCLSVCLSVCLNISATTHAIFTKLLCMWPMSVAWSSSGMFTIGALPITGKEVSK